jgi:hypothetical protein
MRDNKLNDLPEWDDNEFNEEGENWKPGATRQACKALYNQWQQVMVMLNGALDSMKTDSTAEDAFPAEYWEDHKGMILGDAYQVGAKIKSSEVGLYTIRMENAAIIRKNAQFVATSLLSFMAEGVIEEPYVRAIRAEIDVFRELFKNWVSTFEKDEFTDEWGLFI